MFRLQHKITPFLWYDHRASDAAALYIGLFGNGRVVHTQRWGEGTPYPAGKFEIAALQRAYDGA